jgi:divalent metal cation (Fe/Co/Zn/Cd) transporter
MGSVLRRARALSWFSLAWMTGEGILGLSAGVAANSISLIGWALGSVIEGLASIIVIWRFTGGRTLSEVAERRAQRAVALSFFLLAPYLTVESLRDLLGGHAVTTSALGLVVTAASLVVMPLLGGESAVTADRPTDADNRFRVRHPCWPEQPGTRVTARWPR